MQPDAIGWPGGGAGGSLVAAEANGASPGDLTATRRGAAAKGSAFRKQGKSRWPQSNSVDLETVGAGGGKAQSKCIADSGAELGLDGGGLGGPGLQGFERKSLSKNFY